MRRPRHLLTVTSPDGLDDVLARFRGGPLAIDTETSGVERTDLVGTLNLAAGDTAAIFYKDALAGAIRWLARQIKRGRTLVFHNAKFDMHRMWYTFGLHIPYPVHDTFVESFIVDNLGAFRYDRKYFKKGRHSLKPLASFFVDPDAPDLEAKLLRAIRQRGGKHKGDWPLLLGTEDEAIFAEYSAMDPWYTLQLHHQFLPRIDAWPQPEGDYPSMRSLYETERWLLLCLRDMEQRGVQADRAFFQQWHDDLEVKRNAALDQLNAITKKSGWTEEVNWNSHPQLRTLFFEHLQLPVVQWTKPKTGDPKPSTNEVSLKKTKHPIAKALLDYREIDKQFGTYAKGRLEAMDDDDVIHPTFKQTGTRTGRMSCENPNMQQETRESGVRKGYTPRKGLVLRFADYSQVELRFMAHFARVPALIHGFKSQADFDAHAATAKLMFGVKEPSARQRKFAKIINFTTLYGGGEQQVTDKLTELMTLAEAKDGCHEFGYRLRPGEPAHRSLAKLIRARYFEMMPEVRTYTRERADLAEVRGFTINAFGRIRYLDDDKWYKAANSEIQGTAGDKAKEAMVVLYRELQLGTGELAMLLQIHDEIVYESEGDPRTDRKVLELMKNETRFRVPIIADMKGSTTNWQEKVSIDLRRKAA